MIQISFKSNSSLDFKHRFIIDSIDRVLVNAPASGSLTGILPDVPENKFNKKVTNIIDSHFHDNTSAGLPETAKQCITSYSLYKTRVFIKTIEQKC